MSLILEALKKSEQQRRIGQLPTLGSAPATPRRRRRWLPALLALVVLALASGWWLGREGGDPFLPAAAPEPAAPAVAAPASEAPAPEPAVEAAGVVEQASPALPGGAAADATAPAPVEPAPAPAPASHAAPPQRAAASTPPDTPAPAPAPGAPGEAAPAAVPAQAPPAPPPATGAATPHETLPLMWELPYATRRDLPAFTLNMHVYAADSAERFVILDGERHVEGDTIGEDGPRLAEIRADGLVLEFHGQRFLFPREGR